MTEVMWRNVFGHAVYQMLILIIVIFAGQGMLAHNYSDECFNFAKAQLNPPVYEYQQCDLSQSAGNMKTVYNPFFAKGLYSDTESTNKWKAI